METLDDLAALVLETFEALRAGAPATQPLGARREGAVVWVSGAQAQVGIDLLELQRECGGQPDLRERVRAWVGEVLVSAIVLDEGAREPALGGDKVAVFVKPETPALHERGLVYEALLERRTTGGRA
ncbi:hypothetical protein [Chondromyces apiculatus]|uniref:hypothetical protein n=1 Tax=Chondromyces apiculatus TaxID=51 RepID=UPI0012DF1808|nr:hypothetical protein [Chondromyces apiculatus]